ncbi:hypothetical protein [Rhizobium sp. MHM7A]|uniref:hypothetical protein n=1 Tax=Rhizobium sp. MHM7A TaxID=2583233 RepID=UPI0011060158|nr:hypothetical protein [Rhizobium sp. MHM7A]TLX16966.1 hypothetical protein FFR93_06510 [Rhizobium sp. MHM7A]
MTTKFCVMSKVTFAHEVSILPLWSPFDGASSFEHAYSSFAFDDETQANAEAREEEAELKASVESGQLTDADDIMVMKAILQDDGTLEFEDGAVLTAEQIYSHFGIDLPPFYSIAKGP